MADQPEPTAEELIRRAIDLRPLLRAQQDDAEALGHYGPDVHKAFLDAGFYHLWTPRRYGGLEVDVPTFLQILIELSRGDPSTAWCFCLGHGHNLTTAAHWPVEAQEEVFPTALGYYRASHSVAGMGTARAVDGGYVVNARSPYQSGIPYATHATVNVVLDEPDEPPTLLAVIVDRDDVEVLDDWGGDATLGMRGSGSNTVVVRDVEVPAYRAVPFDWMGHDYTGPSVGTAFHGNPLYLGPVAGLFHSELAAIVVGAAKAAVDEYEQIITSRSTLFPPFIPRSEDPDHLADFGLGITMADAAEALIQRVGHLYMRGCADAAAGVRPFTTEMDQRLYGMAARAGEMASDAIGLLFRSAGSSAAKGGQPMERYQRDALMYRGHISAQYRWAARRLAEIHLGRRKDPFART